MKKFDFWTKTKCDFCGVSDVKNWRAHFKECSKLPEKYRKVFLEVYSPEAINNFCETKDGKKIIRRIKIMSNPVILTILGLRFVILLIILLFLFFWFLAIF